MMVPGVRKISPAIDNRMEIGIIHKLDSFGSSLFEGHQIYQLGTPVQAKSAVKTTLSSMAVKKKCFLAIAIDQFAVLCPHPVTRQNECIVHAIVQDVAEFSSLDKMSKIGMQGTSTHKTSSSPTVVPRHLSASMRAYQRAIVLVNHFDAEPSIQRVQQVMDFLRESIEMSSMGTDGNYTSTIRYLHAFLSREDVTSLLDEESGKRRVVKKFDYDGSSEVGSMNPVRVSLADSYSSCIVSESVSESGNDIGNGCGKHGTRNGVNSSDTSDVIEGGDAELTLSQVEKDLLQYLGGGDDELVGFDEFEEEDEEEEDDDDDGIGRGLSHLREWSSIAADVKEGRHSTNETSLNQRNNSSATRDTGDGDDVVNDDEDALERELTEMLGEMSEEFSDLINSFSVTSNSSSGHPPVVNSASDMPSLTDSMADAGSAASTA